MKTIKWKSQEQNLWHARERLSLPYSYIYYIDLFPISSSLHFFLFFLCYSPLSESSLRRPSGSLKIIVKSLTDIAQEYVAMESKYYLEYCAVN